MDSRYITTRLLVADYAQSLKFYRDILSLPVARMIGEGDGVYCELGGEGGRIAIYSREMFATSVIALPPATHGDAVLITVHVPDVEAAAKGLEGKGAKLEVGVTNRPEWAVKTVHLRDPDGNLVEVFEWTSTASGS
jgi:catechol 2,3-dioxygenase-like lactoylglutathione lyase family enzyme